MNRAGLRIAAAALLVVLGIWAGAKLHSSRGTPQSHRGIPVPAGEASAPNPSDLASDGPDATVVTETYDCSDSPEQIRQFVDNGNAWIEAMTTTLERLDQLSAEE